VLWLRSEFTPQSDLATILVPTVLQGAAMAFFFVPLNSIVLSGLSPERIAAASGLSNFARISAGAFGTSISTTLWDNRATLHHAHYVEGLSPGEPNLADALGSLAAAGLAPDQAFAQLARLVDQQAFTRAADDIFLGSAVMFVSLIALLWLTRPPRGEAAAVDAGAH
jgi:DHA2 family multidrug resistance protein